MEDILGYIQSNWQWMLSALQNVLTIVFILVYKWTNRRGKDIDSDGIPDVPARFNDWYVLVDGKKVFLKDMRFYKEDPNAKK